MIRIFKSCLLLGVISILLLIAAFFLNNYLVPKIWSKERYEDAQNMRIWVNNVLQFPEKYETLNKKIVIGKKIFLKEETKLALLQVQQNLNGVLPKHCLNNISQCSAFELYVPEELLKHPKLFSSIVQVTSNPCDYIAKKEANIEVNHQIERQKHLLYCNHMKRGFFQKDKSYTVLYIIGSDGKHKFNVLVPRLDNHKRKTPTFITEFSEFFRMIFSAII